MNECKIFDIFDIFFCLAQGAFIAYYPLNIGVELKVGFMVAVVFPILYFKKKNNNEFN